MAKVEEAKVSMKGEVIDAVKAHFARLEEELNEHDFKFRFRSPDGHFKTANENKNEPWYIMFNDDPDDPESKFEELQAWLASVVKQNLTT